ncbi:hypothetical protein EDD18DRAFT_1111995 [Armillaria luteobubalina]|uniref:Uncharacterized protein n=1 Tax=Armillaria luteobubalina TaxID=153913 RepID=A0AA39PH84_9AGAR|nr:hypothetical protein EDD18DRAFT_1111995 [Armillaria luteobubalina]
MHESDRLDDDEILFSVLSPTRVRDLFNDRAVLCLWSLEDLHALEWKLDAPTIGYVYDEHWGRFFGIGPLVFYLNKMGRPMGRHVDLESERSWLQWAWTLQEMDNDYLIVGGKTREGGAGMKKMCASLSSIHAHQWWPSWEQLMSEELQVVEGGEVEVRMDWINYGEDGNDEMRQQSHEHKKVKFNLKTMISRSYHRKNLYMRQLLPI